MAASAWSIYNSTKEYIGDGTLDMDNDSFNVGLLGTGYTPSATHQAWGDVSSQEISHGSYTAGGGTATSATWTRSAGVVTFDLSDVSWTATSGAGTLAAKYAVIYDDTTATGGDPVSDALVCYSDLSSTGGTVSVSEGNTLTIQMATSGVFTVT